jgi:hypothetical protein
MISEMNEHLVGDPAPVLRQIHIVLCERSDREIKIQLRRYEHGSSRGERWFLRGHQKPD